MCAVYANVLRGGTNSFQTEAADLAEFMYWTMSDGIPPIGTIAAGTPVTGDFAVQALATPAKKVTVKAGKLLIKATPTGESERLFTVTLSADFDLDILANTAGSTRYDVVYVTLPADALHDPAANGDLTGAACIKAERHTAAGVALTATNAIPIAEITLTDSYATVTNAVIADKRKYAQSYGPMDWNPILGTISCGSTNVITVPAGALKRVSVGDKIWCKDDGVEFMGYAVAVTDTTVTVKGGSTAGVGADIAASSTITDLYFSKATSPVGFPQWFSYTPSIAVQAGSRGSNTDVVRFCIKGREVTVMANLAWTQGSTGALYVKFTMPVNVATGLIARGGGIATTGTTDVSAAVSSDADEIYVYDYKQTAGFFTTTTAAVRVVATYEI